MLVLDVEYYRDDTDLMDQHKRVIAVLGKPSLKARLEAYYSLIAPETIANATEWRSKFDQIYQKYGLTYEGERKLALKLAKKYGTAVRLLVAQPPTIKTQKVNMSSRDDHSDEHDESWYELRPQEKDSNDIRFLSATFDPHAALTAPEKFVVEKNQWLSDCSRLDTVYQFALHLPKGDPQRLEPVKSRKRTLTSSKSDDAASKKSTRELHPFQHISQSVDSGPLARLHDFQKKRVRVLIRYVNAIRGELIGTLVAFDKHMNLILRNAEETYSMRPAQEEGSESTNLEMEVNRRRKLEGKEASKEGEWYGRRRTMKNIMVRGDTVVSISTADETKAKNTSRYFKRNDRVGERTKEGT